MNRFKSRKIVIHLSYIVCILLISGFGLYNNKTLRLDLKESNKKVDNYTIHYEDITKDVRLHTKDSEFEKLNHLKTQSITNSIQNSIALGTYIDAFELELSKINKNLKVASSIDWETKLSPTTKVTGFNGVYYVIYATIDQEVVPFMYFQNFMESNLLRNGLFDNSGNKIVVLGNKPYSFVPVPGAGSQENLGDYTLYNGFVSLGIDITDFVDPALNQKISDLSKKDNNKWILTSYEALHQHFLDYFKDKYFVGSP